LAVSNIAWPREQDAEVAEVLHEFGIGGIEIAPTKIWSNPIAATDAEIDDYRRYWNERGIAIVAAQALLFGKPDLTIFESADVRRKTLDYLAAIVKLCARLGAGSLVFGSPKNRRVGDLAPEGVRSIAREFFARLGEIAAAAGTCIVMEANPPEYGADFATTAAAAIELVKSVDHPGFRLHLDTGCMTLAGDSITSTLESGFALLKHFHVSEPNLDPPGTSRRVDHAAFAAELQRRGYAQWVSLEMREPKTFMIDGFAASVRWLKSNFSLPAGERVARLCEPGEGFFHPDSTLPANGSEQDPSPGSLREPPSPPREESSKVPGSGDKQGASFRRAAE
jgi:sugar phosphate isomerase/epimerase